MNGLRTERLYVRLTAEEAAVVAERATARGLSVSDFVRARILRGSGRMGRIAHRAMNAQRAHVVRQLSIIAAELRRLDTVQQDVAQREKLDLQLARIEQMMTELAA